MAKELQLSLGMIALVDDLDYELVYERKWFMRTNGYAAHNLPGGRIQYLHRVLTDAQRGYDVDHENGDRLDCRRQNIRACTRAENCRNRNHKWPVQSRFLGVHKRYVRDTWFVMVLGPKNTQWYCGDYRDELQAAMAFDRGTLYLRGSDAKTNFPGAVPASPRELLLINCQIISGSLSGYWGVIQARHGRWRASLSGKTIGVYDTADEAARARDVAALARDGHMAKLNFQMPTLAAAA